MLEHRKACGSTEDDGGTRTTEASERLAPRGTGVAQSGGVGLGHQRLNSSDSVVQAEAEEQHQEDAGQEVASSSASQRSAVHGSLAREHRHEHRASDDGNDAGHPADPQSALTADSVRDEANADVGSDSSNVVPRLQGHGLSRGEAIALEPGGDPGVHAVHAELANEVCRPDSAGSNDELGAEEHCRAGLLRLRRNDQQVGIELDVNVTGCLDDLGQAHAGLLLLIMVGIPVRRLMHDEEQDDAVHHRQSADEVADAPVLHSRAAVGERDLTVGETRDYRNRVGADRCCNKTSDNPAHDHEGHAEGNEDAALLGRHALGEHRGDDRDAGANAEASDQAECAEECIIGRECLRQREQAIEDDRDGEHLLTADGIGHDAANSTAEHHAEQAPGGQ